MATRTGTRTLALEAALAVVVVGCSRQSQATPTPAPASQPVAAPAAGPMRGADAAAADRVLRQRVEKCPVTIANGNGPPGEYPSPDDHGNGALWTGLPPGGIDQGGTPEPDGSTSQKYWWYTVGTTGELTIQVQRDLVPDRGLLAGHRQGRRYQPDVRGVDGQAVTAVEGHAPLCRWANLGCAVARQSGNAVRDPSDAD